MRPRDYILKQCIIVMLIAATFVTNANNINNAKITLIFLKVSFVTPLRKDVLRQKKYKLSLYYCHAFMGTLHP
jgi:hypothetical protein